MKISPTRAVAALAIGSLGVFCTCPALADPVLLNPGSASAGGSAGTAATFSDFVSASPPTAVEPGSGGFAFVDSGLPSPPTALTGIDLDGLPAGSLGQVDLATPTGAFGANSFRQATLPNQLVAEVWPPPDVPGTPDTVVVPLPAAVWMGLTLIGSKAMLESLGRRRKPYVQAW